MSAKQIPSVWMTTKGYRALRRTVGIDLQPRVEMETYCCGGLEIGCSTDEREEWERDGEGHYDFEADVIPPKAFAEFANYLQQWHALKVESFGVANGPEVQP